MAMNSLSAFSRFASNLKEQEQTMPVLFIGHGSPMNGIENNEFSSYWKKLAKEIPTPKAVLTGKRDEVSIFNDKLLAGSLSITSVKIAAA